MCDPLTIAGIALTAGSTVANSIAQNKIRRARDDSLAAERIRQGGLDREADAINLRSQDRYQDFEGQQDDRSGELTDYFNDQTEAAGQANAAASEALIAPQSGSDITVREEANQRGKAREFTDQQGEALGSLRAFGDLLGEVSRSQARDASLIGQIGGFKRGSSSVLPYELDAAMSAGDGAKTFGDILGLGGSVAMGAGLTRGPTDAWPGLRTVTAKPGATRALGGAVDRLSMPGYSGQSGSNLYSLYR